MRQQHLTVREVENLRNRKQPFPHMSCNVRCNKCGIYAPLSDWKISPSTRRCKPGDLIPKRKFKCPVCKQRNSFSKEIFFR